MRPAREKINSAGRTYFVTSQTAQRRPLFRAERLALLFEDVLCSYSGKSYALYAYVIMPDHFHALLGPIESLERAMQKIKGGFSFRAKRELEMNGEIWQPGFSDHRIRDLEDWHKHKEYIRRNPVKALLCFDSEAYEYLKLDITPIPQWLKPLTASRVIGAAEAAPLQGSRSEPFQTTHDMEKIGCRRSSKTGFFREKVQAVEGNGL